MPTHESEILGIISNLKNSSAGCDGLSVSLIKKLQNSILAPLVHICNTSFSQGKFPNDMKVAKVIPIYKKGDSSLFSNYRPISVLPAFSKILEKLVYNRMMKFINKNNILNENQFGFREHRSTEMAILKFANMFYDASENNDTMFGIFLDFSHAFDSLSHEILLKKIYNYGFRGKAYDWINDYLSNRKQFVQYNNSHSNLGDILSGVPQGSILGPLLFLLYVNDIHDVSDILSCIQYADDTTFIAKGKD